MGRFLDEAGLRLLWSKITGRNVEVQLRVEDNNILQLRCAKGTLLAGDTVKVYRKLKQTQKHGNTMDGVGHIRQSGWREFNGGRSYGEQKEEILIGLRQYDIGTEGYIPSATTGMEAWAVTFDGSPNGLKRYVQSYMSGRVASEEKYEFYMTNGSRRKTFWLNRSRLKNCCYTQWGVAVFRGGKPVTGIMPFRIQMSAVEKIFPESIDKVTVGFRYTT